MAAAARCAPWDRIRREKPWSPRGRRAAGEKRLPDIEGLAAHECRRQQRDRTGFILARHDLVHDPVRDMPWRFAIGEYSAHADRAVDRTPARLRGIKLDEEIARE